MRKRNKGRGQEVVREGKNREMEIETGREEGEREIGKKRGKMRTMTDFPRKMCFI